jgi:hypothetical protein
MNHLLYEFVSVVVLSKLPRVQLIVVGHGLDGLTNCWTVRAFGRDAACAAGTVDSFGGIGYCWFFWKGCIEVCWCSKVCPGNQSLRCCLRRPRRPLSPPELGKLEMLEDSELLRTTSTHQPLQCTFCPLVPRTQGNHGGIVAIFSALHNTEHR